MTSVLILRRKKEYIHFLNFPVSFILLLNWSLVQAYLKDKDKDKAGANYPKNKQYPAKGL